MPTVPAVAGRVRSRGAVALLLNALLSLGFAAAVGGAVHLWRRHMEEARRDDLQALAARRGWALTVTGQRLGRAGTLRMASRGGHPWTVETRAEAVAEPGAGPRRATDYEADEPAWAEGTMIVTLAGPEEPEDPGDPRARRLGGDLARMAASLARRPAPDAIHVLADADPSLRVDLADLARALAEFRPTAPGDRGGPILILSPEGMRLRVRHAVVRADHMERFVDLALALTRLIGP